LEEIDELLESAPDLLHVVVLGAHIAEHGGCLA
jgi:hypothetical protein